MQKARNAEMHAQRKRKNYAVLVVLLLLVALFYGLAIFKMSGKF